MTDEPQGFTLFSVLDGLLHAPDEELAEIVEHFDFAVEELAEHDVTLRGVYDVSGLRADADVMVWWHAATIEQLQAAYHGFLRTEVGQHLEPVWSNAALHRPRVVDRKLEFLVVE